MTHHLTQPRRRDALRLAAFATLAHVAHPALSLTPTQTLSKLPRLVTVSGAITEIVYALGAESQLVGTDTTSLFPAAALNTAKVGYMRQLSAEGLLSLKPDAVIATTEAGPPVVLDQIRSAGVKVELVKADHSWAELIAKVQAVGRASGRTGQAAEFQAKLEAEWLSSQRWVEKSVAKSPRKPRVLFILSHSTTVQVSGEKTAANAVIQFAGGTNCLSGFDGYRPMTAEAMAAAAPDIILTSTQGIEAQGGADKFWSRPELALTPAFKNRALVTMDALQLLGFGPRLPQAVREVHDRMAVAMAASATPRKTT